MILPKKEDHMRFFPSLASLFHRLPRMGWCLALSVLLLGLVGLFSPQQLPVIIYKGSLLSLAGTGGYWLDRWAFPYARPDSYLVYEWKDEDEFSDGVEDYPVVENCQRLFIAASLRRAAVMAVAMLAVGLGL